MLATGTLSIGGARPFGIECFAGPAGVREIRLHAGPLKRRARPKPAAGATRPTRGPLASRARAIRDRALAEIAAWSRGRRTSFTCPVDFAGQGTPFQRAVWHALLRIPAGETRSYAQIARAIGRPGAARAVGLACGRNPIPIIVPCHRVVGADGSLTGFSSGLALKALFLDIEAPRRDRKRTRK